MNNGLDSQILVNVESIRFSSPDLAYVLSSDGACLQFMLATVRDRMAAVLHREAGVLSAADLESLGRDIELLLPSSFLRYIIDVGYAGYSYYSVHDFAQQMRLYGRCYATHVGYELLPTKGGSFTTDSVRMYYELDSILASTKATLFPSSLYFHSLH